MKGAALPDLAAALPPAAGNGTHRIPKKNKPAQQRIEARFVITEAEPIDAPMWPVHTALWLQSEMAPSTPVWTGLAIERHNRIPAPDFPHAGIAPPNRSATLENSGDPRMPSHVRQQLPQSNLAPLGWEPRAICRKPGGE